jgi:hypothetical protein
VNPSTNQKSQAVGCSGRRTPSNPVSMSEPKVRFLLSDAPRALPLRRTLLQKIQSIAPWQHVKICTSTPITI